MATEEHKPFVTVTSGMSGFFAVQMCWNPNYGGFWEPWETGIGRYETRAEAIQEAKEWADSEGLEYKE